MFTTGVHLYLNAAAGCYALALILSFARIRRFGVVILFAGFIIHSLYLAGRAWLGDVFIPNAMFEGPFFLPWCLSLITLESLFRKKGNTVTPLLSLVVIFTLFSICYVKGIIPATPKKSTIWALLFFIPESFAHAFFYVGGLFACIKVLKKESAFDYSSWIVWGIILYTIAQVTGAVWCFLGWGNTFSWGARHLSSAAIWTFYVGLLHLKFIPVWRDKTQGLEIFGAIFVFIISYGHYLHEMSFPRIGG